MRTKFREDMWTLFIKMIDDQKECALSAKDQTKNEINQKGEKQASQLKQNPRKLCETQIQDNSRKYPYLLKFTSSGIREMTADRKAADSVSLSCDNVWLIKEKA